MMIVYILYYIKCMLYIRTLKRENTEARNSRRCLNIHLRGLHKNAYTSSSHSGALTQI
jgi:hypothetical protein